MVWFIIIMGVIIYVVGKVESLENKSSKRSLPPNTRIDYASATNDILLKGKKEYYKNNLAGKYDKPYNSPVIEGAKEVKKK